jgi:hypothetical protein
MARYYAETETPTGRWMPCLFAYRPDVKSTNGVLRLKRADGLGPRLRFMPKRLEDGHGGLSLDEARNIYAPDGRFRTTRHRSADELAADAAVLKGEAA